MSYVSALDKARELGATVQLGIGWDWAIGFTKEGADKFIEFLNRYKFEHRGQYPGKEKGTIDIRFRPQIVTVESNALPPRGTGRSNPGHHSVNLNRVATSAVVGVATGGIVYGLAKWKEEWFKKNIRLAPRYLAIILGASTFGLSYRRRLF